MPSSRVRVCLLLLLALVLIPESVAQSELQTQHRGVGPVHIPGRLSYPIPRDQYSQIPLWSRPHIYRWEARHQFDQYVGPFPNEEVVAHLRDMSATQGVGRTITPLAYSSPYTDVITGSKLLRDDVVSVAGTLLALLVMCVMARVVGGVTTLRRGASSSHEAVRWLGAAAASAIERARRRLTDGVAGALASVRCTAPSATKGAAPAAALPSSAPATRKARPRSAGISRPVAIDPGRTSRRRLNAASRSCGAPIVVANRAADLASQSATLPPPRCLSPVRWQRPSPQRRRAADRRLLTEIGGALANVEDEDVALSEAPGVHPSSPSPAPSSASADDDEGDTMASLFEVWENCPVRDGRSSQSASPRETFPSFEYLDYHLRRAMVLFDCEGPVDVDCPLDADVPDGIECGHMSPTDTAGLSPTDASLLTHANRHATERNGSSLADLNDAAPVTPFILSAAPDPVLRCRVNSAATPIDGHLSTNSRNDSRVRVASTANCGDTDTGDLLTVEVAELRLAKSTEAHTPSTMATLPSAASTSITLPKIDLAAATSKSVSPRAMESVSAPSSSSSTMKANGRCGVFESGGDTGGESLPCEAAVMDIEVSGRSPLADTGHAPLSAASSLLICDAVSNTGVATALPRNSLPLSTASCLPATNVPLHTQMMPRPYLPAAVCYVAPPPPIMLPAAACHRAANVPLHTQTMPRPYLTAAVCQVAPPQPILLPPVASVSNVADFAPRAANQGRPLGHVPPVPISHGPVPVNSRLPLPVAAHSSGSAIVAELLGELSSTSRGCRAGRSPRLGSIPNLIAAGERARQASQPQAPSLDLSGVVAERGLAVPSSSSYEQPNASHARRVGASGGLDVLSSTALALSQPRKSLVGSRHPRESVSSVPTVFTEPRLGADAVPPEHLSMDTSASSCAQASCKRKRNSRTFLTGPSHSAVDESTARVVANVVAKPSYAHRAFGVEPPAAPRRASSERPLKATRRNAAPAVPSFATPRKSRKRKPCSVASGTTEGAASKPSYAQRAFGVESPVAPRRASSERPLKATRRGALPAAPSCATPRKNRKRKPCSAVAATRAPLSDDTLSLSDATPIFESALTRATRASDMELADRAPKVPRCATAPNVSAVDLVAAVGAASLSDASNSCPLQPSVSMDIEQQPQPSAGNKRKLSNKRKSVCFSSEAPSVISDDVALSERPSKSSRVGLSALPSQSFDSASTVMSALVQGDTSSIAQAPSRLTPLPQPASHKRRHGSPSHLPTDVGNSADGECHRALSRRKRSRAASTSNADAIGVSHSTREAFVEVAAAAAVALSSIQRCSSSANAYDASSSNLPRGAWSALRRSDDMLYHRALDSEMKEDVSTEPSGPSNKRLRSSSLHEVGATSSADSISGANDEVKEDGAREANAMRVSSGSSSVTADSLNRVCYPAVFTTRADAASTKCLAVLRAIAECSTLVTRDALADFAATRTAFSEGGEADAKSVSRMLQFLSGTAPELRVCARERNSRAPAGVGKFFSVEGRLLNGSIDALSADFALSESPDDYFMRVMDAFQEFGERRSRPSGGGDLYDFEDMRTVRQAREHLVDLRRACVASRTFSWLWQLNRTCTNDACGSETTRHFAPQHAMHVSCAAPREGGGKRRLNTLAEGLARNFEAYVEYAARCPTCGEEGSATSVMAGLPPYLVVTLPEHAHDFTYPIDGLDLRRFTSDSDKRVYDLVAVVFEEDPAEADDEEKSSYVSEREWVTAVRHLNTGDGAAVLTGAAVLAGAAVPTGAAVPAPAGTRRRRRGAFVRFKHGEEPRRLSRSRDIVTPDARLLIYEQRL